MKKEIINKFQIVTDFKKNDLIIYLNNVLKMGRIVQGSFYKLTDSYFEKNKDLSHEVIKGDNTLDNLESSLEYEGMILLTSSKFSGIPLKANFVGIKLIYLFENLGDLLEENAKINLDLLKYPQRINNMNFEDVFSIVKEMLSIALNMFSNYINFELTSLDKNNLSKYFFEPTKKLSQMDTEINSLFNALKNNLFNSKFKHNVIYSNTEILANLVKFSDYITNIAEIILWGITGIRYKCRNNKLEYFYSLEDDI